MDKNNPPLPVKKPVQLPPKSPPPRFASNPALSLKNRFPGTQHRG